MKIKHSMLAVALGVLCGACGASPSTAPARVELPTAVVVQPPRKHALVAPLVRRALPATVAALSWTPTMPLMPAPTATFSPTNAPAPTSVLATENPAAAEAELARRINETRAAHDLPPYEVSDELSAAARAHSCDLAAHALISHLSSDGLDLTHRLQGSHTHWQWPSENIAAGSDDSTVILHMWMDEPPDGPHLLNILNPDQQAVGIGYCFHADDPSGNKHYWTADFARR